MVKRAFSLAVLVVVIGVILGQPVSSAPPPGRSLVTPPMWANSSTARSFAYVVNGLSDTVSVIDTTTNTVIADVPVGHYPRDVAITPDGAFAYVANSWAEPPHNNFPLGSVSVIDVATHSVVATVGVGYYPYDVAITPDGAFVYVANFYSDSVSVIATATHTVVATVSVRWSVTPHFIAITPDGASAYVVGRDSVSVIDVATNTVVATVPVPVGSAHVAFTPDGAFAYVPSFGPVGSVGFVSVIATASNTVVATVEVLERAGHAAVTSDGAFVYVLNGIPSNAVSVIETGGNTVVATIPVGDNPQRFATTPDGAFVYVPNAGSNTVSVIETASNTVVATVGVGLQPARVAFTPDGAFAYVVNPNSDNVAVIETATRTRVAWVPVGNAPGEIAITQVSPTQLVGHLTQEVQALIDGGVLDERGNGLLGLLTGMLSQIAHDKPGALTQVNTFIGLVQNEISKGSLTAEQGQPLIDTAQAIIDALTT